MSPVTLTSYPVWDSLQTFRVVDGAPVVTRSSLTPYTMVEELPGTAELNVTVGAELVVIEF